MIFAKTLLQFIKLNLTLLPKIKIFFIKKWVFKCSNFFLFCGQMFDCEILAFSILRILNGNV